MCSVQRFHRREGSESVLRAKRAAGGPLGLSALAFAGLMGLGLMVSGCEEDTTTVIVPLCDPVPGPPAVVPEASPPSTDGGLLRIPGHHFWNYSSTANVADPADPTPTPASSDVTPTPTVTPLPAGYVLELSKEIVSVRAGGLDAPVQHAYEQVVTPYLTVSDLEGNERTADCSMCVSCLSSATYACGDCEGACIGCEQVVEVSLPPMSALNGTLTEEGLKIGVAIIGPSGIAPTVYTVLPFACDDGYDNDNDGAIDALDLDCFESPLSESPVTE